MPWMAVEEDYRFDGPAGPATLLDLFEGRRQLIVYRAFYGPEVTSDPELGAYPERARVGCSFLADQVAHPAHLNARDTSLAFVSRAPQSEIAGRKARMGWDLIPWYTLTDDFDADFGVDEWHGTNAFIRDGDRVFRTYFVDSRGDEAMGSTWSYLDLTALGRQEQWEDSPEGYPRPLRTSGGGTTTPTRGADDASGARLVAGHPVSDRRCRPDPSKFAGSSQASSRARTRGHSRSTTENQAVSRLRPLVTIACRKTPSKV
jgi:predicted dithiol-disulfide oxidoreductase (DUF899 family)